MTLSCERSFKKNEYGPGILVNEVTIADVGDVSGETGPFFDRPWDIGVRLFLEVGRDFQPELVSAGEFKRNAKGEVIGWGSAFVVQEALMRLGYSGDLDSANRIPFKVLQSLVGKKFLRLTYVSRLNDKGRVKYTDWNQIGTLEEGPAELVNRFKRSLSRGYPKNYRPEVLEQGVTEKLEVVETL